MFGKCQVRDQRALVVRSGEHRGVAIWTEYEIAGARQTEVLVLVPERTLLPLDGVAHSPRHSGRNVPRDGVERWLTEHGYSIAG